MSGTLYLVATPIGNLSDMTYRAVSTLNEVDIIACEDTRHSMPLLQHYGIRTRLVSYHQHNEKSASVYLISQLQAGLSVAIITDAGTPCISDPGSVIVQEARAAGIPVTVVPGASAITAAAALVGVNGGFVFNGFLPERNSERDEILTTLRYCGKTTVFYISPHSLAKDINSILAAWGDRHAFLVRELTKMYEEVIEGNLSELLAHEPRGEYVLLVDAEQGRDNSLLALSLEEHIKHYLALDYEVKEAAKLVAKERDIPRNEVYKVAIQLDKDKK